MTVHEAIAAAESTLPGHWARAGEIDPRWQAVIGVGGFIESEPETVWSFIVRWGGSPDEDLRAAIGTCLLEHLLEHHFDEFISRVEKAAQSDPLFGDMVASCWKFGEANDPDRATRFDQLVESIRKSDP